MRAVSLFSLLLLATLFGRPAFAETEVRAGLYKVHGTNFDGSPYSGEAKISISSDTTCEIVWHTGSTTSQGICMRDSESFAAAYRMGSGVGLVIYRINDDGSLEGVWTIAGKSGAGTEKLTPE